MFDGTPNALASLALLVWPLAAWVLWRRLGPARGLIAGLVASYLLLPPPPAGFDLPMLPPFNKDTIPPLAALLLFLRTRPLLDLVPAHPVARALLGLYVLAPFATILTNPDPVFWGPHGFPGLRLREAVGVTMLQGLLILPLLLARALLAEERDARAVLGGLLVGALLYSLPMLVEVRLSPQVNVWVYGFFQHSFEQMMRDGGYRPLVFLYHGLWAAFLASTAVMAAAVLARASRGGARAGALLAGAWMAGVLVLCKSMASLLYAALFAPLLLLAPLRSQLSLAAALALLALAYPAARGAHLVPVEAILDAAQAVDPDRAGSLAYRFRNEEVLLARASERAAFGWGLWGRNHVHDVNSGRQLTVTDGRWIVVVGMWGWSGFLAEFGLLTLPIFLAWGRRRAAPAVAAGGALILAVNLVDLIPNATLTPLTWLLAGTLLGWAERARAEAPARLPLIRTAI